MKFLSDRQEIAEEINIKRTPVITIDISKEMDGWEGYNVYEGSKVRVATPSKRYPDSTARCTVHIYGDGKNADMITPVECKEIQLNCWGICLHSDFGYNDVVEMVEWSRAPIVKADDKVIVVFDDRKRNWCAIRKMKVGKVSAHCSTVATLIDAE